MTDPTNRLLDALAKIAANPDTLDALPHVAEANQAWLDMTAAEIAAAIAGDDYARVWQAAKRKPPKLQQARLL